MGEGSYFNFDLIIEQVGEKYRARVIDSPAGQASTEFDIPFSELELENFVLRMGRPRAGVRRVNSPKWKRSNNVENVFFGQSSVMMSMLAFCAAGMQRWKMKVA